MSHITDPEKDRIIKHYKKESEAILFKMYQLLERAQTKKENILYRQTLTKLQQEL